MSWFRVSDGRLDYRGRITKTPFTRWCETKKGREAVERVAGGIRFSLFGKRRAARSRLWRALEAASQTRDFQSAVATEAARYMELMAASAYADALPRAHVALRRLVLAPRAMIAGRAHLAMSQRLGQAPELATVDESVRGFLIDQLVTEMDAALRKASPSAKRPVHAHEGWACVGVHVGMVWVDSLWAGPDGTGHVFLYEFPPAGLSRRDRKALEAAISRMSSSVSSLSRMQRGALVRAASYR